MADRPTIRITVSGAGRAGKSVLISRLATVLALRLGVDNVVLPPDLPAMSEDQVSRALYGLERRGLRVEVVEVRTEDPLQVDARPLATRLRRPISVG